MHSSARGRGRNSPGLLTSPVDVVANNDSLTEPASGPCPPVVGANRSRGSQLLLLALLVAAASIAWSAVGSVQESMRIALALSDNQMALLQGPALALPLAITGILLGRAIDRMSRVRLVLVFALINLLGSLLTAYARNFATLFAARCLIGLVMNGTDIAVASLLSDLFPPAQRGRANVVVVIGQVGGGAAAFALGGVLVAASTAPNAWAWAILWLSVPLAVSLLLLAWVREPPRTDVAVENPSSPQVLAELWRYRALIAPLCAGLGLVEVAFHAVRVWAAPTLQRGFALSPDRVGLIMFIVILLSGVLGSIAGGSLADSCQRTGGPARTVRALSLLALVSGPAVLLFPLVPGVGAASTLLLVFMMLSWASMVMTTTLITIVAPNELRGLSMGISAAVNALFGVAGAPVTVSALSGVLGGASMIGTALAIVAATSCAGAALLYYLRRQSFEEARP